MNEQFQNQHAASLARIVAGADVLAARVTRDDEILVVRAEEVGKALVALHGNPVSGLVVAAQVEYVAMPADEFASMTDYQ